MIIAVSGASGFVASKLLPALQAAGHTVKRLVRRAPQGEDILWNPGGSMDSQKLEGIDAVVHLAGENIGQRWNENSKARIMESRKQGTRTLSEALAALSAPPQVLVSASAIGYYGDRGSQMLTEESGPGKGFLADVCVEWEKATEPAAARGIRVANLRFGIVLDRAEGALAKMLLPFRLGVGGKMGSGDQYWSWVAIEDVVGAIRQALTNQSLQGPVNTTAPNPVTNAEFAGTLARVLKRPAIFPMPAFAARAALGEMADALLLSSARVAPTRLIAAGYQFQYPELEGALRHALEH